VVGGGNSNRKKELGGGGEGVRGSRSATSTVGEAGVTGVRRPTMWHVAGGVACACHAIELMTLFLVDLIIMQEII
jgi:hypothetical protein